MIEPTSTGDKGSMTVIDDDTIEIVMHEGVAVPYDELKQMYSDFEIVDDNGVKLKLVRKK